MSDAPAAAIPPGWYTDPSVSGQLRWWSGTAWTEHVSAATSGAPRPALPADRPVYSVFIWLIVLLPLLSYGLLFAWQPDFSYLATASSSMTPYPTSLLTPGYFLLVLSGWLVYGLSAVFAWRDVAWLRAQGVVRPFPWPWVFLSSAVYVIGRSVIVYRVASPRGRAPIWLFIAVFVVGIIMSTAWSIALFSGIMSHLPAIGGYTG